MRPRRTGRALIRCGLAAALLLLAPYAAGHSQAATPPPPRFVPIPNHVQVAALWEHGQRQAQMSGVALEQPAVNDVALISKSASPATVAPDGTLHYAITLTNTTNLTQTFQVTDTLPAGVAYITPTAASDFVYNAASGTLTATHFLDAFHGDVITATGAPPYTEISSTVSTNICLSYPVNFPECDDNAITLIGVPFRYLGVDYDSITLDSNGFVMPGSGDLGADAVNQNLPDAAPPNNVIAPFWTELDLRGYEPSGDLGGGDWWYGVLHDSGSNADYLVVEWHHAQKEGNPATDYSFQVWIQLHVEHITFAYDSSAFPAGSPAFTGDTSSATIGFENSDGTLGHSYLFTTTVQPPGRLDGAELGLVTNFDVAQLGFDVLGLHSLPGCSTITNTVELARPAGAFTATATTATATTASFGPCRLFPLISR